MDLSVREAWTILGQTSTCTVAIVPVRQVASARCRHIESVPLGGGRDALEFINSTVKEREWSSDTAFTPKLASTTCSNYQSFYHIYKTNTRITNIYRSLISLAIVVNAAATFVEFFALASRKGM